MRRLSSKPGCFLAFFMVMALTASIGLSHLRRETEVNFDLYVMAMSYQPEFCYKHRSEKDPGCLHPAEYWKSHLTIHGLWPEFANGSWPATCSDEPLKNSTINALRGPLEHFWPNVRATEPKYKHYSDFWSHEWSKHGTCSGLSQIAYFEAAMNHFVPTPSVVSENYGGSVSKARLLEAYGDHTTLICESRQYLSEVRICLGTMKDGTPAHKIPCPNEVSGDDSCGGSEIFLSAFSSSVQSAQARNEVAELFFS